MLKWLRGSQKSTTSVNKIAAKLRVDIHSHLIPGIDDGAQTIEESLKLIAKMQHLGFDKLVMTPHVMVDAYPNTSQAIREGLEKLQDAVQSAEINIQLDAAAEYYLDEGFLPRLETGDILTIGENYLLFETSYMAAPMHLEELIYAIGAHGYTPLMAHPERYRYVKDPEREYARWRELGVVFQIDTTSLGGHYGKDAHAKARFLLQKGWIDFVGSDTHRMRHLEQLETVLSDHALWINLMQNNNLKNAELT